MLKIMTLKMYLWYLFHHSTKLEQHMACKAQALFCLILPPPLSADILSTWPYVAPNVTHDLVSTVAAQPAGGIFQWASRKFQSTKLTCNTFID